VDVSENDPLCLAIFGVGAGIFWFFGGFTRLRRKRLIENVPTSTVRGMAMGLVELVGKARKEHVFKAPFSGKDCLFYKYAVERLESHGKHTEWVTIASGGTYDSAFWLEDTTGKVLVYPRGAEFIMPVDYRFETGLSVSLPPNLVNFMEQNHLQYKTFFVRHKIRFIEWCITEGEEVYVLGTAQKTINSSPDDHKNKLSKRLAELKKDQKLMAETDENKDGIISDEEWDSAVARLEQSILEEEIKNTPSAENNTDTFVGKSAQAHVFIISEESQTKLINSFSAQSIFGVFGGAIVSLVSLAYILYRFREWIKF